MNLLESLNSTARQKAIIILDDDTTVNFTLEYRDNQKGWFYSLIYPFTGFSLNNRRLVTGPNILRAFRKFIPFGIACITDDGQEPIFQNDFASNRVQLYVLNQTDVLTAEAAINE